MIGWVFIKFSVDIMPLACSLKSYFLISFSRWLKHNRFSYTWGER
jgi:hypothetical protein